MSEGCQECLPECQLQHAKTARVSGSDTLDTLADTLAMDSSMSTSAGQVIPPPAHPARGAIRSLRDGHSEAAQALAATTLGTAVTEFFLPRHLHEVD